MYPLPRSLLTPPSLPCLTPTKGREGEAKDPHYRATVPPGYARSRHIDLDNSRSGFLFFFYDSTELKNIRRRPNKPNYSSINKLSLQTLLIISKPAHAGATSQPPLKLLHTLHFPGISSSAHRRTLYLPSPLPPLPPLSVQPSSSSSSSSRLLLQVALSVQGGGEGHVVEGSWGGVGPRVGRHAGDAVLRLVGGELPPQLVGRDEVLMGNREERSASDVQNLHPVSPSRSYPIRVKVQSLS